MPEKLLTDKTAKIFYHSDAPSFIYKMPLFVGINIRKYLHKAILGFCGVKVTGGMAIGGLRNKTPEQRTQLLEKIAQCN